MFTSFAEKNHVCAPTQEDTGGIHVCSGRSMHASMRAPAVLHSSIHGYNLFCNRLSRL